MGCGKIRLAPMNDNYYKTNAMCIEGSFYLDLQDNLPVAAKGGFGKILKISGMPEKPKAHSNKRAIKHENIKKVFTNVINTHSTQTDVPSLHESVREPCSELLPVPSMARTEDSREPDLEKFSDLEEDKFIRSASEADPNNNKKEEINTYKPITEEDIPTFEQPTEEHKIIIAIQPPEESEEPPVEKSDTLSNIPEPELNQPQLNEQSKPKDHSATIPSNFSNLHINTEAENVINYEEDVPVLSPGMKPSHPADLRLYHEKGESPVPVCISPPEIQDSVLSRADTDSQHTAPGLVPVEHSLTSEDEASPRISSSDLQRV